jgi:hypothetical protein
MVAFGAAVVALAGCGGSSTRPRTRIVAAAATTGATTGATAVQQAHPQVVEPSAGQAPTVTQPTADPVGDVNAFAPSDAQVRRELHAEYVAVKTSDATYIDPLQYVDHWERTDQGVDANLPVGAPILAPGLIKILAVIPNWYAGQPLVYFELLDGPDAGKAQYVAEEITDLAPPGSILQRGQVIARYASSGTGIEYGWSTLSGVTLARATTGYEEGQVTPAGQLMRDWLNALGANAGSG